MRSKRFGVLLAFSFSVLFITSMLASIVVAKPGNSPNGKDFKTPGNSPAFDYKPDELIVKFKTNGAWSVTGFRDISQMVANSPSLLSLHNKWKISSYERAFKDLERSNRASKDTSELNLSNIYLLKLPKNTDVIAAVDDYAKNPNVEYAQPNYRYSVTTVPNDPYYSSYGTWGQPYDDMWGLKIINAENAWSKFDNENAIGAGVVVAVVDTGADYNHPDLAANIWTNQDEIAGNGIDDDNNGFVDDVRGWDFTSADNDPMDGRGHGTHVSGTIAAVTNNGIGVAGISWHTKIMPLKGLTDDGWGYSTWLANGIHYAASNGAKVINNSWGPSSRNPYDPVSEEAVNFAHSLGCVVVFAAGNSNDDVMYYSPANSENVITVSSFDHRDNKSDFSNWGEKIDVAAPGGGSNRWPDIGDNQWYVNILSLRAENTDMYGNGKYIVGENYYRCRGTSMAAPHVSGLAALILSKNPGLTNEDVRWMLRISADDVDATGWDVNSGYGRINAYEAIKSASLFSWVRPIEPYWKTEVPFILTSTAVAENSIENVALWYRYSEDRDEWNSWQKFGVDYTAPWEWSFTASEGDGFYEFYSIVTDNAGNIESAPSRADASCGVHVGPPRTIYVGPGENYTTIQSGVNAAYLGDTIIVREGTYNENVIINTINLTILADQGAHPVVQSTDPYKDVFKITTDNVTISGFTARGATWRSGIYLKTAKYCNVTNNTLENNYRGIYLESSRDGSNNNTLTGNTAEHNLYGIVMINATNNALTNNTFSNNTYYGINIEADKNTLTGNITANNPYGILVANSDNNVLIGNNSSNNTYCGICISSYSDYNTLENNICDNNSVGIELLEGSWFNTITNNTSSNNGFCGLYLDDSHYNILTGNILENNDNYGIYLSYSYANDIYNNYFNNTHNAYDDFMNSWNTAPTLGTNIVGGPYLGGNYWSDYTGEDLDGDGLGDTEVPYTSYGGISYYGGDDYPLVMPDPNAHSPIYIDGDSDFTEANGVNGGGSGTPLDPYIIENWVINAENAFGIHIRSTTAYFMVRNCSVKNGWSAGYYGIYLENVQNGRIENTVTKNNYYGICLEYSQNNILAGNTAFSNPEDSFGIYLYESDNNTLNANNAENNSYDIYLYESDNNSLIGNNAENNGYAIFIDYSDNSILTGNTVSNNYFGIYLNCSSNSILTNNEMSGNNYNFNVGGDEVSNHLSDYIQDIDPSNTINGKPIYYWVNQQDQQIPSDAGFVGIVNSENITVSGLTLTNNMKGVLLAYSTNSRIENITVENNYFGIHVDNSDNNTLTGNHVSGNCYGIYLINSSRYNLLTGNNSENNLYAGITCNYSQNNTLTGNNVSGNYQYGNGIYLQYSDNNILTGNNCDRNAYYGIYCYLSNNNTLTGNSVENNTSRGIRMMFSSNNLIYNNYFSNAYNAQDDNSNTWNIDPTPGRNIVGGWYLGGNYWSDYTGNDTDGDNLGDTQLPYNSSGWISHGGDYHPLILIDITPPQAPTLISPSDGLLLKDNTPTFRWTAVTDPSGVKYTLQYSTDNTFQTGTSVDNLLDNTYTVPDNRALVDNNYYWRARAVDGAGNIGNWSGFWSFTIDATPPQAPTLTSPSNGSLLNDNTPTFRWSAVTDSSGVKYTLQYSTDNTFQTGTTVDNLTDNTYTVPDNKALADNKYYWRVRAVDGAGNIGNWSGFWSFTIDATPPQAPTLTSPANSSTLNDNTPTFRWTAVTDPSGIKYTLQYSTDNTFQTGTTVENLTDNTYTVPDNRALADNKYYWRVRAVDGAGNVGNWSGFWMFTIKIDVITNGSFVSNTSSWSFVKVAGNPTGSWDSAGYANGGCAKISSEVGRNKAGQGYWEQTISTTIQAGSTVKLSYAWKKGYVKSVPSQQNIYVTIVKPSGATVDLDNKLGAPTAYNTWYTVSNKIVSSFFNENGTYKIRLRYVYSTGSNINAQALAWFDEVKLLVST